MSTLGVLLDKSKMTVNPAFGMVDLQILKKILYISPKFLYYNKE